MVASGNFSLEYGFTKALSNQTSVLAKPPRLLDHVNLGPEQPRSTKLQLLILFIKVSVRLLFEPREKLLFFRAVHVIIEVSSD